MRRLHEALFKTGGILVLGVFIYSGCSSPEERFAENIEQANVNLENGEVERAINVLEKLKSKYPNEPQILEALAFAFVQAKEYFTGAFYFNQLAQSFPSKTDYYLYAAQAWISAGDSDSAIRDYEAYLLDNRTDWNTWQKIGDLYLETRQNSKAIHAFSNSSQLRFNPKLELKASSLALQTGNLRQAEEGFSRLLMVEEEEIARQAHLKLVTIKHKRRQWEEVEKLMVEIENRFPEATESPELKQVNADIMTYQKAIEQEQKVKLEEDDRRKRLIEQQRARAEQLARARLAAAAEAENKPEEPEEVPPSELAIVEEEVIKNEEAPESPAQSLPTPPVSPEPPLEKSPFEKALEAARQIASTSSENAISRYWDAINLGDSSGVAFFELSRVYYNRTQFKEAEMTALEALRRAPASNRFLLSYLQIIRKTKPKPEIVGEIRKFLNKYPQNADLVLLLARIYAEPGGDTVAARGLYNLFFEMAPNHPEVDRARYEVRGI